MSIPHLFYVGSEKPRSVFLCLKKVAVKAIKKKKKKKRVILTVAVALFFPHALPVNECQHSSPASLHPVHSQPTHAAPVLEHPRKDFPSQQQRPELEDKLAWQREHLCAFYHSIPCAR